MTIEEKYFKELIASGVIKPEMAISYYKEKCEELQAELDKYKKHQCTCKKESSQPTSEEFMESILR